jgi:hypothetical protein
MLVGPEVRPDFPAPEGKEHPVGLCPTCLEFGVQTPVERRRKTPMKYCTFHYWLMKGREGFLLRSYVEHSKHFGFVISLPSHETMAKMNLAPERGMPELGSLLTLAEKLSGPGETPLFLPLRSATLGPGRTSRPPHASSRVLRSRAWPSYARETPPPICVPA